MALNVHRLFSTTRHNININKRPKMEKMWQDHNKPGVCMQMALNWSQQNYTTYIICVITHYWNCLRKMKDPTVMKCNRMVIEKLGYLSCSYCCTESHINVLQLNITCCLGSKNVITAAQRSVQAAKLSQENKTYRSIEP